MNLYQNEVLVTEIDNAIRYTKKADWVGDYFKEREIANAVREKTVGYEVNIERVMALAKAQKDYQWVGVGINGLATDWHD
ncbi:type I restriction enzyme, R subunit [Nitrosomonas cryotolerans]|uniref:hypothetical protein n=1 Tax=Nitrosomonas cryotolerans TaxID=44575 RepID=UPI00048AD45D|nr:hypothetical protein [Nitrosomonas cryotolerans]SFP89067.1 type I restriction enzyme, R subunit [Nitrosomonas cryotolerans]